MSDGPKDRVSRLRRALAVLALAFLGVTLAWWAWGRMTLESRRLEVRGVEGAGAPAPDTAREIRILTWNLAHGRGDEGYGLFRNFGGGDDEDRVVRLHEIASVIEAAGADVVVLNEADFRSSWSRELNQAEVLARAAGYPAWVEQTNYDLRLPFGVLSFGNAVLTRLPLGEARFVRLPPHRRLEELVLGAKAASVVRLETAHGPLSLVPVHLEPRSEETRLDALPVFRDLAAEEAAPLVLAGDFNSSPPGFPGAARETVVGRLLESGWRSPRALAAPSAVELTYPTFAPARAIDWVLVEAPLEVVEVRVLEGAEELSDHAPVLSVVRMPRGEEP